MSVEAEKGEEGREGGKTPGGRVCVTVALHQNYVNSVVWVWVG